MRVGNRQLVQPVVVGVMWRGDGAVVVDPSPRWAQVELRHDPLSAFVIDAQVQRDPTMTVRWMRSMHRFNLLFEREVFDRLFSLVIDVLALDA